MDLKEVLNGYLWIIKAILYSVIYFVVAVIMYDIVAGIHLRPPTTLFTPIDYRIPFISAFAIFYVFIFYPFIIFTLGYFFYYKVEKADRIMFSFLIMYLISYVTYIIFPVMMIRPSPEELPSDFLSRVMAKYYEEDPPLNCFPSLHAANSTLAAYYMSKEYPKYKWIFWGIAFGVILSTLFVRQHVIVDEIAGFLVAYFAAWLGERYIRETKAPEKYERFRFYLFIVLATLISISQIAGYIP